ncbi:acyl carrier protein [Sphaerisporangium dianthi]|uniref:Acyl carrier protein n=1 Tax=Sphaerisporangium dianthi TaxID=1436120 RepID=A0ABV9CT55_9ACTN
MPETDQKSFEILARTVHEVAGVPTAAIRRESLLVEDLGLDSLALVEVMYVLEERLNIAVPEESLADVKTVMDLLDLF